MFGLSEVKYCSTPWAARTHREFRFDAIDKCTLSINAAHLCVGIDPKSDSLPSTYLFLIFFVVFQSIEMVSKCVIPLSGTSDRIIIIINARHKTETLPSPKRYCHQIAHICIAICVVMGAKFQFANMHSKYAIIYETRILLHLPTHDPAANNNYKDCTIFEHA